MKKMISILIVVLCMFNSFCMVFGEQTNMINIYVSNEGNDGNNGSITSPFRTIEKAKDYIKTLGTENDIVVNILSGEYFIDEKIIFDATDSGKNGHKIIYRGVGDTKPLISGGVKLSNNWVDTDGDGIYEITVSEMDDMRQMYVNGFAMRRAVCDNYYTADLTRYNAVGNKYDEDGFVLSEYEIPKFRRPEDLEIVAHNIWTTHRMPVKNVVYDSFKDKTLFIMDQPYYDAYIASGYDCYPAVGARIWMENALEFLNDEGEFYFDKIEKKLYFKPFENLDLANAEIFLPKSEGLLSIVGTAQNKVSGISFENLDFRHGAYNEVTEKGFSVQQADCIWRPDVKNQLDSVLNPTILSQIHIENASDINFRDCNFSNLGSAAIAMTDGVTDCEIIRNTIHDISATAVIVGSWRYTTESDPDTLCKRINIEDNLIKSIGQEFMSSPAIGVYYARDINILHNDISDTPYTGITLGWGWGMPTPNVLECGNYKVIGNKIVDTMCERVDGGAIYTLGYLNNTCIAENYIVNSPDNGAIYLDSGSASMSIRNNVIKDYARWLFVGKPENVVVTDNYVEHDTYSFTPNTDTGKESYVSGTIVYQNGNWSDNALNVVQNAGLSADTKAVMTVEERPTYMGTIYDYLPIEEKCVMGDYIIEAENYSGTNVSSGLIYIYRVHNHDRVVISDYRAGQTYDYKVNVLEAGEYNLDVRYTTGPSPQATSKTANVYVNGVLQLASADVSFGPSVGSWYTCPSESIGTVTLVKGENTITFANQSNDWAFDNLRLTKIDE